MFNIRSLAISVLAILLMSGCAASTASLIEQAELTGDWTLVNQRIAALERLEAQKPPSCPRGTKSWCIGRRGQTKCGCVSDSESRDLLTALFDQY